MGFPPVIGMTLGDANGIGPEVAVKAANLYLEEGERVLMIGEAWLAQRALDLTGIRRPLHTVSAIAEVHEADEGLYILDTGRLRPEELLPGQATGAVGEATVQAFHRACEFARSGELGGVIFGPVNSDSLKMAGLTLMPPDLRQNYQMLVTGPLRVAHLTHHISLREVLDKHIKCDRVLTLLRLADHSLRKWGMPHPRIAVAGLNPHCDGVEDSAELVPAVAQAVQEGIDAYGPVAPDSVFRQCIDGQYDLVIALYHDQGHIAVKTWGFAGNCAVMLGVPFLVATVAHGSAYEIAWRGQADASMMLSSLRTCTSLVRGEGFPQSQQAEIECE
ncbi:MAG: 4-hydroxythreonine-4-phosphate dehydrogenase PdxA [Pigmentiphaga sp.]